MKAQAHGTNGAPRNSVLGIAQVRKGSTMLKAMILIWLVLLVLALTVVAFMTRFMEKHRPDDHFFKSSGNHPK
jgi:hypothetical protein